MLAVADYIGLYKAKLARAHHARPMPADDRLWTGADIAAVEDGAATKSVTAPKDSEIPEDKPLVHGELASKAA